MSFILFDGHETLNKTFLSSPAGLSLRRSMLRTDHLIVPAYSDQDVSKGKRYFGKQLYNVKRKLRFYLSIFQTALTFFFHGTTVDDYGILFIYCASIISSGGGFCSAPPPDCLSLRAACTISSTRSKTRAAWEKEKMN